MITFFVATIAISKLSLATTNLLTNGNFENGAVGFESEYMLDADIQNEGRYTVVDNPHSAHPGGASFGDHTTGHGLMLAANGDSVAGHALWSETVPVQPGHTYTFVGWGASWGQSGYDDTNHVALDTSPARILLKVNGITVGSAFTLATRNGQWRKFAFTWKSGAHKKAILRIEDANTDGIGNDFALDDFVFRPGGQ